MQGSITKSLLLAIGVVSAGLILWGTLFLYVRASEGCIVGRSDQSLIDDAIKYEIGAGKRGIDLRSDVDLIKYRSIEEFKEKNSRCCTISRTNHEVTYVLDRAIGATEVSINFWYRATQSGAEPFYLSYVVMNACGKPLASHGIATGKGPNE